MCSIAASRMQTREEVAPGSIAAVGKPLALYSAPRSRSAGWRWPAGSAAPRIRSRRA